MTFPRLHRALMPMLYLGISIWFCAPIFDQPLAPGHEDWDQHLFYYGQVLKNVVEYGDAPFWSPWYCGGNVMWQNPQVALLSPVFPLALLVPLPLAMKVNIVLHYWVGFTGMHLLLTRAIGLSSPPLAVALATAFTASGAVAAHLATGHSVFLPVMYLPWTLYWLVRSLQSRRVREALLAGATLALMIWNGGVHVLPIALVGTGALVTVAAAVRRDWRPLLLGAIFVVAGLGYAAPKLYPVSHFVTSERLLDTRKFNETDVVSPATVARVYLEPDPKGKFDDEPWSWHEYANYIGPFFLAALVLGVVGAFGVPRSGDRWLGLGLAAATLLCLLLSFGEFAAWAPASLMERLPLLSSFRIPARYTIAVVLLAACAAAWTLRHLPLPSGRFGALALVVLCGAASLQVLQSNRRHFGESFQEDVFDTSFQWMRQPQTFFVDTTTDGSPGRGNSPMLRALLTDRFFMQCFEPLQLQRTVDPSRPPAFSEPDGAVDVTLFTPNRIEFTVRESETPTRIFLNTNWSPGWDSDAGPWTTSTDRPAFVTVPPGRSGSFSFWFAPEGLWPGALTLVAALALSIPLSRIRV